MVTLKSDVAFHPHNNVFDALFGGIIGETVFYTSKLWDNGAVTELSIDRFHVFGLLTMVFRKQIFLLTERSLELNAYFFTFNNFFLDYILCGFQIIN